MAMTCIGCKECQREDKIIGDKCAYPSKRKSSNKSAELTPPEISRNFNKSGSKYLRDIKCAIDGKIDVYAVLDAFAVTCPARQHAVKKLLCSGIRGKGNTLQDLRESRDAIDRAIQMEEQRGNDNG